MLRIISILIFLITFSLIVFAYRSRPNVFTDSWQWLRQEGNGIWKSLKNIKNLSFLDILKNFKKYLYIITILCVLILAITGFIPFLILGKPLSGFTLLLHVTVTPVFALCMVLNTFIWAHRHRFNKHNWQWIKQFITQRELSLKNTFGRNDFFEKCFFWLIILFSVIVESIVLSMFPIFGTVGQEFFLQLHKLGATLLTIFIIIHTLLILRIQSNESFKE